MTAPDPSLQSDPAALAPYRNRLSWRNRLGRLAWRLVYITLFRPTPAFFALWRRFLLRLFGARLGRGTVIHPSVRIWAPWNLEMDDDSCLAFDVDCYCVDKVHLGKHVTVSQYAFLCTASHDVDDPARPLVTAPIKIEDAAWVFAQAFVGPGVTIGQGAVVAAAAVVVKNVAPLDDRRREPRQVHPPALHA